MVTVATKGGKILKNHGERNHEDRVERNRASKGEVSVEGGQEGWVQELVLVRPEEKCC